MEMENENEIMENRVMLGKITGFPKWPCVIVNENDISMEEKPDDDKEWYLVQFFNDGKYAWLSTEDLSSYSANVDLLTKRNPKDRKLLHAIKDANRQLHLKKNIPDHFITVTKNKKHSRQIKQEGGQESSGHKKITIKQEKEETEQEEPKRKQEEHKPVGVCKGVIHYEPVKGQNKESIGIVAGEGVFVEDLARNLLKAGFSLNVYSTTCEKWNSLLKKIQHLGRVKALLSARAVLINSSKVFLFFNNQEQINNVVHKDFEADNMLDNIIKNKGIINATSVSPDFSLEIEKIINLNGGQYLEILTSGSKEQARNGSLTLYTSGNVSFFRECLPLMNAIAENAYHMEQAGYAVKIHLLLQYLKAVSLAGLANCFSLLGPLGIPKEVFTKILRETELASPYIINKAAAMNNKTFSSVEQSNSDMVQQLKLFIEMGYKAGNSMSLANMLHQMFKLCDIKQYGAHDVSAVSLLSPFHY